MWLKFNSAKQLLSSLLKDISHINKTHTNIHFRHLPQIRYTLVPNRFRRRKITSKGIYFELLLLWTFRYVRLIIYRTEHNTALAWKVASFQYIKCIFSMILACTTEILTLSTVSKDDNYADEPLTVELTIELIFKVFILKRTILYKLYWPKTYFLLCIKILYIYIFMI